LLDPSVATNAMMDINVK